MEKQQSQPASRHIQLNLQDMDQLFNTIDPSPFHRKDLDSDAEDFIFNWAQEYPLDEPVDLIIHLNKLPHKLNAQQLVQEAVHNYFSYRARSNDLEFRRLMKQGRISLLVGLGFLALCLIISRFIHSEEGLLPTFFEQGVTIVGWVAMWKPLEIYLYDWWPLQLRGKILKKLSCMPVQVKKSVEPEPELVPA